jgi:hypothetical protein
MVLVSAVPDRKCHHQSQSDSAERVAVLGHTDVRLNVPKKGEDGKAQGKQAALAEQIVTLLEAGTGRFETANQLQAMLRVAQIKFTASYVPAALEMLVLKERLIWPEVEGRKARPGWLPDALV